VIVFFKKNIVNVNPPNPPSWNHQNL